MKSFLVLLGTAFLLLDTFAMNPLHGFERPFLVRVNNLYGFMDAGCGLVIPAKYDEAFEFTEGFAAVRVGQKWGYINKIGTMVIPPQFAGAWYFSEGLAAVNLEEKSPLWGYIDRTGKVVIQPQFGTALWFSDGLLEGFGEKNHILNVMLGYVNSKGEYVIRLDTAKEKMSLLSGFSEGLAAVQMQTLNSDGTIRFAKWGYIDHSGNWVIAPTYYSARDFHEGLAIVYTFDTEKAGYIDKSNQLVIRPRFELATDFSEGLAAVEIGGLWGYIDQSGELAIPPQCEHDAQFQGGMAICDRNRKLGYINKRGEWVVAPSLDEGSDFIDGVAAILDGSGYRVINTTGHTVCHLPAK